MAVIRPDEIPQLGELLRRDGKVAPAQIAAAIAVQRERGGRFGEILVAQGVISPADLRAALRKQWRLRAFAAAVAAIVGLLSPMRVVAAPGTTLTVTGFVPPSASMLIARDALAVPTDGTDGNRATTQIVEQVAAPAYSLELASRSAAETGQPALRPDDGSVAIPYRLSYGGAPVVFDPGGKAVVSRAGRATGVASATKPLVVAVAEDARYTEPVSDTLTITVRTH